MNALGDFLRSARARLTPADVGLPSGARRRTPGLRREEVAQLCGISTTWYTWIEQGRDIAVSPAVWARLAEALHLSRAERHYLFELAEVADPDGQRMPADPLPQGLAQCVDAIATPAYILDRCWNVLACNAQLLQLFGVGAQQDAAAQDAQAMGHAPVWHGFNLLHYIFLDPRARHHVVDWESRASRVVAEFRADAGAHMDEPDVQALLARLQQESSVFAYWWTRHAVVEREGGARAFRLDDGTLRQYLQFTFRLATRPDCKLVMLLPAQDGAPGHA